VRGFGGKKQQQMNILTDDQLLQERKDLCNKLKEAREAKKLTVMQVAQALNLDRSVISKIELGYNPTGIDKIILLCRFYGLKLTI
jgi:transcriptional regulator with XRE-family HTH domain